MASARPWTSTQPLAAQASSHAQDHHICAHQGSRRPTPRQPRRSADRAAAPDTGSWRSPPAAETSASLADRERVSSDAITGIDYGSAGPLANTIPPRLCWIISHHPLFQMHYYGGQTGADVNAREAYRGAPWFDAAAEFCERYDENCFDPGYDWLPPPPTATPSPSMNCDQGGQCAVARAHICPVRGGHGRRVSPGQGPRTNYCGECEPHAR